MDLQQFLPEELPERTSDFSPLPVGEYLCVISDCELRETNDGTGKYLSLKWQVMEGDYEGRIFFENINIQNKSEKATQIGLSVLGEISKCIMTKISKTEDLIDKICTVSLGIQPASGQYEASNKVKKHFMYEGYKNAGDTKQVNTETASGSAQSDKKAKPGWMSK